MTTRFVYSIVAMFSGDSNQTFKLQSYSQLKSYLLRKTKRKTKRLFQFQKFRNARVDWLILKRRYKQHLKKRNEKHRKRGLLTIDTCYLFFGECVGRHGGEGAEGRVGGG